MPTRAPLIAAVLAMSLSLIAGCAETVPVRFRVADESGKPVPGAMVSAAPLRTTDVPLPVDSETLTEMFSAKSERRFGVTDERGHVTLTLIDRPHALTLDPPALDPRWFGPDAPPGDGAWLFSLDPATGQILPAIGSTAPTGLTITATP